MDHYLLHADTLLAANRMIVGRAQPACCHSTVAEKYTWAQRNIVRSGSAAPSLHLGRAGATLIKLSAAVISSRQNKQGSQSNKLAQA